MNYKYFYLSEFCYFVSGQAKSALYNLLDGDIFSLDERTTRILKIPDPLVEEKLRVANSLGMGKENVYELLNELVTLGLGKFSNEKLFIDKIKMDYSGGMANEAAINLTDVSIRVTDKCDFNCFFCSRRNSQICFPCTRKSSGSRANLLEKNIQGILNDTQLFGCETVRFIGGDPFAMGESFLNTLVYAAEKIKNVEIFTNLSSITNIQKKIISQYNICLIFPFFGNTENSFESITQKKGSFKKVWENILELKSEKINIKALILKRKDEDVENTVDLFKLNDIHYNIYAPTPLTRNKDIFNFTDGFKVKEDDFANIKFYNFFQAKIYNVCLGRRITIDLNGNVKPCLYSSDVLGSIFKESLRNILREGKQDRYWNLTKDYVEGCKSCEYRYGCSFDCAAASKYFGGKITAQYPFCSYNPYRGNWENKLEVIHERHL